VNNFLEKYLMPAGDILLGSDVIPSLNRLRSISKQDDCSLRNLQKINTSNLLYHALNNVPYYKSLFRNTEISELSLKDFPVIDKHTLNVNQNQLIVGDKNRLYKQASSGSTGVQSVVYWNKKEQSVIRATQLLWWEWAGYKIGDPVLQTGITPNRGLVKSVKDKLLNTYYLQAFSHKKDDIIKALLWAKGQKNPFLAGYASSLYVIARFAIEEGIEVSFKGAVSWGDKLFNHYKSTIKSAFGVDVHETYGSAEGLMMGAQRDLDYMYLMSPNVYVEIVDKNNREVEDGQMGDVLVTNLISYSMPLIRYRIGDIGIKLPTQFYPENRLLHYPLWQKVIGRDTDLVRTPGGKYMVVHSFTGIFEHISEIRQFCVVQNSLDGITIQYVRGSGFETGILIDIENRILEIIEEPFNIIFEEVDIIHPTKSGKPQLIISRIPNHNIVI